MKKSILFGLLVMLLVVSACSDTVYESVYLSTDTDINEATPLTAPDMPLITSPTPASAANYFAFRLSATLASGIDDENFIVSPYSVWLPLMALMNATDPTIRTDMLAQLGMEDVSMTEINNAVAYMLSNLQDEQFRSQHAMLGMEWPQVLHIANAIFVDYAHTLRTDFSQIFHSYFDGEAMNVDFECPSSADIVNAWAYEKTNGRIQDIIDEFCEDTAVAIANAIYFHDGWRNPFRVADTEKGIFNAPVGPSEVYFMQLEEDQLPYFEDDTLQAVTLHFAHGGGLTILLPRDGDAVALLSTLTYERFAHFRAVSRPHTGRLLLPRFSIESTIDEDLIDALTAMGLEPMFCDEIAPLSKLVNYNNKGFISDAVQKAMIEVNEYGTTAAAVTVMSITAYSALIRTEPFEMICDRPFVFVLHRHNQVLFTGVVNQP